MIIIFNFQYTKIKPNELRVLSQVRIIKFINCKCFATIKSCNKYTIHDLTQDISLDLSILKVIHSGRKGEFEKHYVSHN